MPGCAWTAAHSAQGFARRDDSVCFSTLLEFGHAIVSITAGSFQTEFTHQRVIAVPFTSKSGRLVVEGPEEFDTGRTFELERGHYRLIAAQRVLREEEEQIDLFFEVLKEPLRCSLIFIADDMLNPAIPLLETADVASI
jgi:hypothetical protein